MQTLRPTYRLLIGIPGKSNAFAISRRLGLDESVIQAAQAQMDSDSVRFEDVLTQLEEKRQRLEKAQAEADRLWRQREEDARKARTFREQMEKPRTTPAPRARPRPSALCVRPRPRRTKFSPSWTSCAASSKSSSASRSSTMPKPPCGTA